MGSLLPLNSGCPSFIVLPSDNRPQQTGALARLPVELMHMVAKNMNKPRTKDLRSLALSSAKLFNAIRPFYYKSGRFEDFREALKTADVARMERCYQFGGVDASIVWRKKHDKCKGRNELAKHRQNRPIDILLSRIIKGEWNPNFANALMWLCSKGFSLQHWPGDHHSLSSQSNMMPESLIQLFQRGIADPGEAQGISKMIQFLSGQGLPIPLRVNPERAPGFRPEERQCKCPDCASLLHSGWLETTMAIALRSHCPPMILEVLLQEYAKRGLFLTDLEPDTWAPPPAMKDWYDAQEPFFPDKPHHKPWFIETDFGIVVMCLYRDLMEPASDWEYPGQVADIWEAKMKLLIRYSAIDEHELSFFKAILKTLREIAEMPKPRSDGNYRWHAFRNAVHDCASASELLGMSWDTSDWFEARFPEETRRPHRFYIEEDNSGTSWNIGSAVVGARDVW
ncbi:hypothetical protein FPANT_9387 [Fusarium pseudoanthophilum]|uniref:Uncharacterized protein n=1 Tax=Fusarium pseudoanthophilum TaxID=48495 RepID=A0A8H5KXE5_9HYPO|nr:hypothetical protein FPANT_9387 [Fusarium pseudoanthophilum]